MRIDPLPDSNDKLNSVKVDSLNLLDGKVTVVQNNQEDLTKLLLYEIIRVKQLIQQTESISNNSAHIAIPILNELVAEAYNSLVNYDLVLMKKYYDLLQNCD
ncbi:MAG: hypothetical protein JST50_06530 [Bacteroidetes bacterium]|jgi:hypothetical protein|nr:hypothetical protein [Bacteroidota bacterium]